MARNGKIARLPRKFRDELNRRLDNAEPGEQLVAWLNSNKEVRAVLARHFDAHPITEQNLSEWKQGGFQDWLRDESIRVWVRSLADQTEALRDDIGFTPVSDCLSATLAVIIGQSLQRAATAVSANDAEARKEASGPGAQPHASAPFRPRAAAHPHPSASRG